MAGGLKAHRDHMGALKGHHAEMVKQHAESEKKVLFTELPMMWFQHQDPSRNQDICHNLG